MKEFFERLAYDGLTIKEMNAMAGGGDSVPAPVAPVAPIQDNSAQIMLMQQSLQQQELLMQQMTISNESRYEADYAAAQNLKEIELRDAMAQAEKDEREDRIKKQKRDLLYMNAIGVDDDEEDDMLLLGGNY